MKRALPKGFAGQALDILSLSYYRHRGFVNLPSLSPWWASSWKTWTSIRWPINLSQLPPSTRDVHILVQPIWLGTVPELQVSTPLSERPRGIGQIIGAQRRFRQTLASTHRTRCLYDFLEHDGGFPSLSAFQIRFLPPTGRGATVWRHLKWLASLHAELLQVFQRVRDPAAAVAAIASDGPPRVPVAVGASTQGRVVLLPATSMKHLRAIIPGPQPVSERQHPLLSLLSLHNRSVVGDFVEFDHDRRSLVLPVCHDVQRRLAFRLLPVGSRFSFLQRSIPDVIYCRLPSCGRVENERHLFFECTHAAPLWTTVNHDWFHLVGTSIVWSHVVLPGTLPVASSTGIDPDAVRTVWYVFRACALHQLWRQRNEFIFEGRRPLSLVPQVLKLYSTFAAHLRHLRRYEHIDPIALDHIVSSLRRSSRWNCLRKLSTTTGHA